MPAIPKQPVASFHLTVFIPRGSAPKLPLLFSCDSIPLTPERLDLLRQLVGPDKWKRQGRPRRVTWDDLQAAAASYLDTST